MPGDLMAQDTPIFHALCKERNFNPLKERSIRQKIRRKWKQEMFMAHYGGPVTSVTVVDFRRFGRLVIQHPPLDLQPRI